MGKIHEKFNSIQRGCEHHLEVESYSLAKTRWKRGLDNLNIKCLYRRDLELWITIDLQQHSTDVKKAKGVWEH